MKKLSVLFLLVSIVFFGATTVHAQTPTISSFTPASGAPGTLFTITGTNLSSPTAFKIGGVAASGIVVSNTGTSLVGMVMPGAATGTVAVTTAGGTATSSGTFTIQNTSYPIVQQGNKLVGTNGLVTPGQGWSVALSADGTTALVGGYYDNNGVGATWAYTRSGNTWTQQAKLIGTGAAVNAWQGFSVALSADGNTAIIGGVIDNSAWVFTRSGTTWAQQGNKLVASDRVGNAWFGRTVALSADGNTAIVGGYQDNTNAGAAWVFIRSGNTWTQEGTKLVGTGAVGAAGQGHSVSLSADGSIAAIGGAYDDSQKGATWIFTRSGNTWAQQGNKLVGNDAVGAAKQGQSVALSADGTTLIVGGVNATSNVSNAWVYTRSGTTWTQQGSKLSGTGAVGTAANGTSVTLTADGTTAMMGSVSDNNNTGAAWVFFRSGTTWTQQGNKLLGTGAVGTTLYEGRTVALSADGSTALVGADGDNTNQGAVWTYSTGVIYDGNGNAGGSVPSSALATIGSSTTLATNTGTLVKFGYTFAGWNTLANGTGTSYAEGASYTFAGTVTLYAQWTANNYTVTFDANGGTGTMSNQTIAYNASSNLTSNTFTRTGYSFAGWATTSGGAVAYANGASYTISAAANVTLYAKWTINNYTVTFNANGGTGTMSNQSIAYLASANLTSNAFTRTGYTFAGWATTSGGTVAYANGASFIMSAAANVILYAQWDCNTAVSTSSTPTLCINTVLTNITHTTTGATGIGTATGLPTGVSASWANNTITISGTPTVSGTFTYSIPLTGGCSSVSATGTITVTAAMVILLPVDNVPNASLALSLRKLRSAYSGPALRLRRGSDNVEQDFAFVGNDLDVNAITTWLNGASGYCTKLYDQSGNGGDVSQTDPAAQPLLVLSGFNNKPLLRFTTIQTMYNAVNYPAPFSVIYGSRVIGTSARVLSAKNNNWLLGYWGGSQDRAFFEGWISEGSAATVLNQYNSYAATGTGSISTVYKNGVQIASNGNGLTGPNGIQLNGAGYGGSLTETSNCEFTDVIVYGSALPAATIAQLSDNTAENYVPSRTLCINTPLTNIIYTTIGASGIGTSTNLPAGVSALWLNNTLTIYGTPTAAGIFNYSIPLTGGCGSVHATGTITVIGNMIAGAASSTPTLCLNTPLTNITHITSNTTGIGTATGLPAGVTAAFANNTITISGTPTESGVFNYSIGLSGGCTTANATGTITVNGVNAASSTPTLCINTPLTNITHTTTGVSGIGTATNLPAGVSASWANNTITISGTPTASGIFNYSIPLTGGCGNVHATGTITVFGNMIAGAASSTPTLCANTPLTNITHITSNTTGIGTATGLPAGVSAAFANNTITISGTPIVSGIFNYSIGLTGSCSNANATGTITVNGVNAASSTPTPCINTPLTNITHTTTGASGIGAATNLPAGVSASWANNTITIIGTPTASGIFNYSIPLIIGCGNVNATGTINVGNIIAGAASSTPTLCVNTALTNITHTTTVATGINTYPAPSYTMPPAISSPTNYEDLENVTITSNGATVLNNTTSINSLSGTIGTASGTVGSYADFTAFGPYAMYPGATYSFSLSSITTTVSRSNTMAIYIDYNRNGLFTDDGEKVYAAATTTPGPHIETGTFTIPLSASFGLTRMRVICGNAIISSPTQGFSYGEYEEYSINLGRSGGLPAGLSASWTNNTVTISGTPTESGIFNYSIGLTGDCSTATATGTITVNPADRQPSAGSNGNLTICSTTNLTPALLFAALRGTPAAGGVWSPTPDVANGSITYTYTQPEIAPCGNTSATVAVIVTTPTVVGNDLSTSIITGKNVAITPNIAPASATALMGYTNTNFKGLIAVDPTTGVINITNAYPAGNYSVIVKASDQGCAFATIALTVTNPPCSQRQFIANPTLTFTSAISFAAVGDFNGDGKQDIATAHGSGVYNSTSSVSIRLGDGLGGFSGSTNVAVGSYPRSLAIGDFNRDGKQDIATANYNSASVSILLGDGLGGLSAATNVAVGSAPQSVVIGDFNRDGKQDIATANFNSASVSIRLGDGLGGFSGTTNVAVGSEPSSVAVGDFNSDGKQDIATANDYSLSIRLGDGLGGFSGTKNVFVDLGSTTTSVAIVDFNGDGKQDITTTTRFGSSVSISLGDGLGGISGTTYVTAPLRSQAIGDFNGDGKQDIIGVTNSTIYILSDDGFGGCTVVKQVLSTFNFNLTGPTVGDFNGDGIQDLAIIRQTNPGYIWIRLGSNGAEINLKGNGVSIPSGNTNITLADNTDLGAGTTRAFTIQNTGTNALPITSISISGTDASFFTKTGITLPVVIAAGSEITFNVNCFATTLGTKTATVTINSDDCDESAYTFNVQRTLSTTPTLGNYTNATVPTAGGNATIIPSAAPTNCFGITATTSAGFKGKLAVDAATGTVRITNAQPAGTYQIIVHAGFDVSQTFTLEVGNTRCSNGQFLSPTFSYFGSRKSEYTQVADFNNDGYQDFAVLLSSDSYRYINVQLNSGYGSFTNATTLTLTFGDNVSYFTIDDFNGDGNADIVVKGTSNIYACIGNGLGGFTIGENVNTSSFSIGGLNSILSNDVDKDGKIDLVVTGTSGFAVLKGNGIGGFILLNTYSNGINFNYIEKGDFNGDGNTDLSMAGNAGNHIYLGNGIGGFIAAPICNLGGYYRFSTVGDFDGDGKSDILSALGNTPGTVAFLKNNGDGNFAAPTFIAVSDQPYQVVSGDFNGDGKLDFAVANSNFNWKDRRCTVSVRYGNGDGTFYGTTELFTWELFGYLTFNVADFNNDGIQDLGISEYDNGDFTVYLGAPSPIEINVQGNAVDIVSGDSSPAGADDTDFGTTTPNTPITKTYTIQNGGTSNLVVSNITLSGTAATSFTVGGIALPATIAAGTSTTFTVTFNTSTLGVQSATISINNNDCDESVYTFKVQGRDNYIIFNGNGGFGQMSDQTIVYNTSHTLTANAFTRTGYSFTGWNTAADGSGASYANGANYTMGVAANVTLYAQWLLVPTISVGGPLSFCAGENVVLTSSSATGNQWYKGGVLIAGAINQAYTATQTGVYTVKVTENAIESEASAGISVTANSLPTAGITNNTAKTVLTCTTTSISVTATGGTSYAWDHGLGNAATASITAPGTYTVTVTNSNGCTDTESITITEEVTAAPVIASVSPTNGSSGTNITISGSNFGGASAPTVTIGGVSMVVSSVTPTSIVANLPSGICGGAIVVKNSCDVVSNSLPYTYAAPVIASVSPTNGISGTSITISGSNFGGASAPTVTIGGVSMVVVSATPTSIIASLPAGVCGGEIVVKNSCDVVSNSLPYTYAAPVIASVSPSNGTSGTSITISGSNFGGASAPTVTIGGVSMVVSSVTPTSIVASLPSGICGGAIVVKNSCDVISNSLPYTYAAPVIASVSPSNGTSGTSITISGSNFGGASAPTVTIGGVSMVVSSSTPTSIVASLPSGICAGAIVVKNSCDVVSNSLPYTYAAPVIASVSPSNGTSGTTITISGSNFGGASAPTVTIDGVPMVISSATPTSIIASLPSGICGGAFVVKNSCDVVSNSLPYTYAAPVIASVSPSNGTSGTSITISGSNFGGVSAPTVTIGGVSMAVVSATQTSILATLPSGLCGGEIVVTNICGLSSNAKQYVYSIPTAAITNNSATMVLTCTTTTISVTATGGASYDWDNGLGNAATASISVPGTYTVTVTNANGCTDTDSITITQNVTAPTAGITNNTATTVLTCVTTSISVTATGGTSYSWSGGTTPTTAANSFAEAGTYTVTVTNASGCSATSSVVLTQLASPSSSTAVSICSSAVPYLWNGGSYTSSGVYTYTSNSSLGCDSVATLNLTVLETTNSIEVISASGSYIWHGNTYASSTNTPTWTGVNAAGCDSVVTLHLTITCTPTASTQTVSACGSFVWKGTTYTTSGAKTWTGTNAAGCDSVVTLNLTIKQPTSSVLTASACDSYAWKGTTYTTSGAKTWTGTNAAGCDSVVTLNLTIRASTSNTTTISACDSYTWAVNGITYTTSGTYTLVAGCHTETLNLTILASPAAPVTVGGASCGTGTVSLSATAGAGIGLAWYSSPVGTTVLSTAAVFTTPTLSANTTYYVAATRSGCSSARAAVAAVINALPDMPAVTNGTVCGSGVVTLGATPGAGNTIDWYSAATNGTLLSGGSAGFSTPSLGASTTYYAQARNTTTGCVSARTVVTATLLPLPAEAGVSGATLCGSGAVTLTATVAAGMAADWYSAAVGGSLLQSGASSYTTGVLTETTTYYVQSRNTTTGCLSATRTAVKGTINITPAPAVTGGSNCGAGTVTLSAVAPSGTTLAWFAVASGGTGLGTAASYTTPSLSATTTYFVEARNSTCISARAAVTATILPVLASPTVTGASRCGNGRVTLGAATSVTGASLQWLATASSTAVLGTGTSYMTDSLTGSKTYYVAATTGATCRSAAVAVTATVNLPLAAPGSLTGNTSICSVVGTATLTSYTALAVRNAVSYKWTLPAGAVVDGSATGNIIKLKFNSAAPSANLGVQAIASNGCEGNKKEITLTGCTAAPLITSIQPAVMSIALDSVALQVQLYPNPSQSFFRLRVQSASRELLHLRVLDLAGREIKQWTANPANSITFGRDLKPGAYFVELLQGKTRRMVKAVKI